MGDKTVRATCFVLIRRRGPPLVLEGWEVGRELFRYSLYADRGRRLGLALGQFGDLVAGRRHGSGALEQERQVISVVNPVAGTTANRFLSMATT